MIKIIGLVLIAAVFSSFGQIFFKLASNKAVESKQKKKPWANYVRDVLKNPWTGLGILFMTVSLVLWLAAISCGELSLVYPTGSVYYIFVLILAHFFLKEKIGRDKILGTLLILAGIAWMTLS